MKKIVFLCFIGFLAFSCRKEDPNSYKPDYKGGLYHITGRIVDAYNGEPLDSIRVFGNASMDYITDSSGYFWIVPTWSGDPLVDDFAPNPFVMECYGVEQGFIRSIAFSTAGMKSGDTLYVGDIRLDERENPLEVGDIFSEF